MDSQQNYLPRYKSAQVISEFNHTVHTPSPKKNKLKPIWEMLNGIEDDTDKRDTFSSFGMGNSGFLNRKLHSCLAIITSDRELGGRSETESNYTSEATSPEKFITDERVISEVDGITNEIYMDAMPPSRAENPQAQSLDDFFAKNNEMFGLTDDTDTDEN